MGQNVLTKQKQQFLFRERITLPSIMIHASSCLLCLATSRQPVTNFDFWTMIRVFVFLSVDSKGDALHTNLCKTNQHKWNETQIMNITLNRSNLLSWKNQQSEKHLNWKDHLSHPTLSKPIPNWFVQKYALVYNFITLFYWIFNFLYIIFISK